ncbi:NADH-quinone oxidoreductase subunit NuoE [Caldicellulosiruptor sp. DIB 104C]|uniref:NADH-quinone oxidoreductase subunit NuoE n=1 Tax=Caldicellulosiruptor sp. DIB 104C TaxID=3019889 RepID=UPI0023062AD1|nr:NADH-quinone oxidoreductase subunit NuoE [Caldicellulosiruptor sp. DIB 104C]
MSCPECENRLVSNFKNQKVDLSLLDPVLDEYKGEKSNIIAILQKTQEIYGFLPLDALSYISEKTGVKKAKIYGIATFYAQFRLKPVGKYVILQCQGTACHVNGSEEIKNALCDELNIKPGDTTEDGMFTLEEVACLGCCSLAPVMMINGETYGKLTPDKVREIIRRIYEREKNV